MEGDVEGSEARDIWKLAAYSFSSAPSLPLHERGIIGAVCGNSEPLLQLAKSWEDRVWALLKAALGQGANQCDKNSLFRNLKYSP